MANDETSFGARLMVVLDSIKIAHSIFALPFALMAMLVAAQGWPAWQTLALILVCMVSGRSAAMAFNRLVDRRIDAGNPRTASRPTVTGKVSPRFLTLFVLANVAVFWLATWFLNTICFVLALPVLAVLLGYSLSKRFTSLCHFWLGLSLGLAPLGAHLAVRGDLQPLAGLAERWGLAYEIFPILLGMAVLFWTAGFDLIYACQDYEVDVQDQRVHSMPKVLGITGALIVSALAHVIAAGLLLGVGWYAGLGGWYWTALVLAVGLLIYEHWVVRPSDLSRVNLAFFTLNGVVGLLLFAAVVLEI